MNDNQSSNTYYNNYNENNINNTKTIIIITMRTIMMINK